MTQGDMVFLICEVVLWGSLFLLLIAAFVKASRKWSPKLRLGGTILLERFSPRDLQTIYDLLWGGRGRKPHVRL